MTMYIIFRFSSANGYKYTETRVLSFKMEDAARWETRLEISSRINQRGGGGEVGWRGRLHGIVTALGKLHVVPYRLADEETHYRSVMIQRRVI